MSEQLGKIEKPEADSFKGKRKLFVVSLVYADDKAPAEYSEIAERYWAQAEQQIDSLEEKLGKISFVYHESLSQAGEDGIIVLEQISPGSSRIIKKRADKGAALLATEEKDLFDEATDWLRFLLVGFVSQKVANLVTENYMTAQQKRYEHISQVINETLKESGPGLLVAREGHRIQFPSDVEVFLVAPPALDELRRWQREHQEKDEEEGCNCGCGQEQEGDCECGQDHDCECGHKAEE